MSGRKQKGNVMYSFILSIKQSDPVYRQKIMVLPQKNNSTLWTELDLSGVKRYKRMDLNLKKFNALLGKCVNWM